MSIACKSLVLFLFAGTVAAIAYAQSPREQLNQLILQFREPLAAPRTREEADRQAEHFVSLRERIIKLAQEIKPPPAVPEEAERRMARGSAAFRSAKSENDFRDAAREFEQASHAAPWSGDIYYNLGVAQDKAGDYAAAIRNLKLAMLAAPDSRETKTLLYEVEYRQEKASSPQALAAKQRSSFEFWLQKVNGARFEHEYILGNPSYGRQLYSYDVRGRNLTRIVETIFLSDQARRDGHSIGRLGTALEFQFGSAREIEARNLSITKIVVSEDGQSLVESYQDGRSLTYRRTR